MVVPPGTTGKLPPLEEVPIGVPPVGLIYQAIELPPETVALKLDVFPQDKLEGEAVGFVGR